MKRAAAIATRCRAPEPEWTNKLTPSPRKYRADILALVAYLVLAIVLTYPLILRFTTHIPGDGSDDPALAWNLWWVPYSILHLNSNPIYTNYMFYPIGLNLAFYTLTYLNAFLSIPVQFAFNLVVAANVNLLFSFALSGFGAYLLTKFVIRNHVLSAVGSAGAAEGSEFVIQETFLPPAAFVAGALYAFSSNKLLYASLGQFNIASSHWIPFYFLILLKLTTKRITNYELSERSGDPAPFAGRITICDGFLLGLFLLFQALSEFIFASFLILFTVIYLLYLLLRTRFRLISNPKGTLRSLQLLITFLVAALTFTLPMLPILAAMVQDMLAEGDFIQQGLGFANVFSSDVLGFFVPSRLNPILGGLEAQFNFAYTNFAYLGYAALALAVLALWKVPAARVWGTFAAIFILISLGPDLRVNGNAFPATFLPFNLLLEIPFVKGNRYPSRWSVMVTLALAVMVGYGILWTSQKLKGKRQKALLAFSFLLLALLEHLSVPLPISNLQSPPVYETIAQDQGNFTVLEIPLAWRNGYRMTGTLDTAMMFAQWYQTAHRHPILGGNTSRNPEFKFQYFTESPIIQSLIAVETSHKLDDAALERDKQLAPDVLRFFGVRYVVWHSPRDPQNRAALDAARAYIERVLPVTKFYDATDEMGETIAYRVFEKQAPGAMIRPADALARLHFAEGWGMLRGKNVWATRREAKLFARRDRPDDATLTLRFYVPMSSQTVKVNVNGNVVSTLVSQRGLSVYSIHPGPEVWRAGMNEIVLQFDVLAPVASVRAGDFAIGTTGHTAPASIVVSSAGSEVGDFAHIYVNGVDAAQNTRGYNVVVNDRTGAVETSAAFDTFASVDESARLARFIAEIPNGRIVAVAVRDEGSRYLTQDAVNALRSIGASEDLRGKWRWSHAIIGVKGAAPGTALEMASESAPAQVVVGIGATEPNVAAAVEWIEIR
ncbi:MAG: hypothetical protein HY782_04860 [Chloroflexi bacterium]|nr:hypothetical protein [Chloroflexota bacterium]